MSTYAMQSTAQVQVTKATSLKFLAIILILTISSMLSPFISTASAFNGAPQAARAIDKAGAGTQSYTISGDADVGSIISNMKYNTVEAAAGKQTTGTPIFTGSGNTLTVNYAELQNGSKSSQRKVLGSFVDELNKSTMSPASKDNVMQQISSYDTSINKLMIPIIMDASSADLYGASKVVNPFMPIFRVIFGILTIGITLLLVGTTILDIIAIVFPLSREMFQKDGQGGGNGRISWVSSEANSVIAETEGSGGGSGGYKNTLFMYFKRRLFSYIVLAFCLLYLVLGELGGLIGWLLTLGEGIVN